MLSFSEDRWREFIQASLINNLFDITIVSILFFLEHKMQSEGYIALAMGRPAGDNRNAVWLGYIYVRSIWRTISIAG